ncbi:6284_t:CDS:2 [Funneliformis caledonium]|uniref:6284_t:CDS:1 n=1 Tax=Funneliformis caledonium TaxID=1117310 RepID=A0A9N9DH30_9GLOM|nr:6284_t:CDS:2 [Funneliformis caledonium]
MHGKKPFRINRVSNERASSCDQCHHHNNQDHRSISPRSLIERRCLVSCDNNRDYSIHQDSHLILYENNREHSIHRDPHSISHDDDREYSIHQDSHSIPYDDDREHPERKRSILCEYNRNQSQKIKRPVLYNSPRWSDDSNRSLSRSSRLYKNSEINEIETINSTLKHLIKEVEVLKSVLQVQSTCLNKGKGSVTLKSPEGYA